MTVGERTWVDRKVLLGQFVEMIVGSWSGSGWTVVIIQKAVFWNRWFCVDLVATLRFSLPWHYAAPDLSFGNISHVSQCTV